jgi:signal transduction histidine kinase
VSHPTLEQLRTVDLLDGLEDPVLERLQAVTDLREVEPGAVASEQGETAPGVQLLLTGRLEAVAVDPDGREDPVGEQVAPTWIGAIAVVTGGVSRVRMRASTPATIATIPPETFIQLMLAHRAVFDRVMHQVRPVVGRLTAMEQNRERLASLGTMAAGLAHELNNPATAARRAADDLAEALEVVSSTIGRFVESGIERAEAEQLVELQRQALAQAAANKPLSALDKADAEDELLDALQDLGVPEPWRLVEPLASAAVDSAWLERVGALAGPATPAAMRWVAASITARNLAGELAESTRRMSSLVAAVKSYTYMDRGETVEADIHDGLDTTLTVLGHKLKHTEVELVRHYDRSLPKLMMHGGELNQVWTNLIDNAIDAVDGRGTITITTALDGPCVRVDVADDGPGIDPELRQHIFDPFFTTKEVGAGTGLGLDTSRRIVAERHRGSIAVDSEPGQTVFHVWLPVDRAVR